jgi:hypothetical protein
MALIQKFPDSNAARPTSNQGENTEESKGEPAMMGYVVFPFPQAMPAVMNTDIKITKDLKYTEVNQGTSVNTYQSQDVTYSSESGEGDGASEKGPSPKQFSASSSDPEEKEGPK